MTNVGYYWLSIFCYSFDSARKRKMIIVMLGMFNFCEPNFSVLVTASTNLQQNKSKNLVSTHFNQIYTQMTTFSDNTISLFDAC